MKNRFIDIDMYVVGKIIQRKRLLNPIHIMLKAMYKRIFNKTLGII